MTTQNFAASDVWGLLSEPRLRPYLERSNGDPAKALELYEWSTRMAATAFETVSHLEVIMRNAIDRELRTHYKEDACGIPWFLLRPPTNDETKATVSTVRDRLRPQGRDTRHQIVAGLSFGFWSGMLGRKYEELWRQVLRRAFSHSPGERKQVAAAVEGVRKFRRPHSPIDTVVVPAREAWTFYEQHFAYVCQPGRSFQPVDRVAFYVNQEIKTEVPRILDRRDNVPWTAHQAAAWNASTDRADRKMGAIINAARTAGWSGGLYQVFVLSRPGDPVHRTLGAPIPHSTSGRGSAFVQRQRYVSLHALETAQSTDDLRPESSS